MMQNTPRRLAASISMATLALAALAGCDRRTPDPEVPSSPTTPMPSPMPAPSPGTGTGMGSGTGTGAMPPASAASR